MPRYGKAKRLSKLQKGIFRSLKRARCKMDYGDLREDVMELLKIHWHKEDSFKASFSRSLSNMARKGWIKRIEESWFFSRRVYHSIKLSKKGLLLASALN